MGQEKLSTRRISLTITKEMHRALQKQTRIRRITFANLVRRILQEYLEQRGFALEEKVRRGGYRVSDKALMEYARGVRVVALDVPDAKRMLVERSIGHLIPVVGEGMYQNFSSSRWYTYTPESLKSTDIEAITINHPIGILRAHDFIEVRTGPSEEFVCKARIMTLDPVRGPYVKKEFLPLLGYASREEFLMARGTIPYLMIQMKYVPD